MDQDCLFCKMAIGTIPVQKVYEDGNFFCIRDIHPQAKTHLLLIPKEHIVSLATAFPENGQSKAALVGDLFGVATQVARKVGLLPGGFRTVMNVEKNGGQTVFHLHLHILGGEILGHDFG